MVLHLTEGIMKKVYENVDLVQPTGSWFTVNEKFDPANGGFYPLGPLAGSSDVDLARHSGEDGPKFRTILELVQMAQHAGPNPDVFGYLLGDSPYMMRPGTLDMRRSETWNIPKAMSGEVQTRLDASIEHLVTAQSNELWETLVPTKAVPIDASNVVLWTVIEHQPAMARETTPMGLPTMVEAKAWTDKKELSLFSIGGRIGHGFWMTARGTRHWYEILFSIASGIVAASQFSAAIALAATSERYARLMRDIKTGYKPTFDFCHDDMARTFALFQDPNHNYFSMLITMLRDRARIQNADAGPWALVTTPEAKIALLKANKDGIAYHTSGPEGPARLKEEIITRQSIYGIDVYSIPSFRMPNNGMCQPFSLPYEIGERVEFFDETPIRKGETYDHRSRNRRIFTDRGWVAVTFRQACENLSCYDAAGNLRIPNINRLANDKPDWWTQTQEDYAYFPLNSERTGPAEFVPRTREALLELVDGGGRVDLQIMAWQLYQRGFAHSAYWMLPGRVAYRVRKEDGHAVVEDSFEQHVHQVSCMYSAGAPIVFPKNLVQAPNVFVAQTEFGKDTIPIWPDNFNPNDLLAGVTGSIIYILVPGPNEYRISNIPRNLNVRGIIDGDLARMYTPLPDVHANSYPGYIYYDALYGFSENKHGIDRQRDFPDGNRTMDFPVNICVRQACYQLFDAKTEDYTKIRQGDGYWKFEGTYNGAGDHRNGGVFKKVERGKFTLA